MIKKIKMWIRFNILRRFVPNPTSFSWTVTDFEALRRWAQCQPHPHSTSMSLWEAIEERDSVWALSKGRALFKSK
jgi:hypothetical protein